MRLLLVAGVCFGIACGSSGASTEATDAGVRRDATPEVPACLVDPPTDTPTAPSAPLAVTPKVLWTKPLGFKASPKTPLFVTADGIVVASGDGVRIYDREGNVKRSFFFRGIGGSNRIPMVVGPDDRIYVGAKSIHRIDPDGTETDYALSLGTNLVRDTEWGAWVSDLALGPTGVLHVLGTDGILHGYDHDGGAIYTKQIAMGDLLYGPSIAGMGATVIISETLFDARDGRRLGRSHINGDRWAIQLGHRGQRLLANAMTATVEFSVVDACGKVLRSFPPFTETALPSLNTFDGGMLWTETLRSDDRLLIRTDDLGREKKRLAHYWGVPKVIGADGTIYAIGTPAGQAAVVALSEDLVEKWQLPLPGGPPYSAAGLGSDGVLYLADDVADTLTAVQTTSPGLANVPNPLSPWGLGANATNWVGDK
jgi:hypothetical protein